MFSNSRLCRFLSDIQMSKLLLKEYMHLIILANGCMFEYLPWDSCISMQGPRWEKNFVAYGLIGKIWYETFLYKFWCDFFKTKTTKGWEI